MKGPMKGAMIGHAKQKIRGGRYVGISEPGIIASESPNPTVNELVILPDIEKRLEAFVRLGHSFIVFPGGAGTMEEILYLLGLAMLEENKEIPLPVIFTGPESGRQYFATIDRFLRQTLGDDVAQYYEIIIANPEQVAQLTRRNINRVTAQRRKTSESYAYNWRLKVPDSMQVPFIPTHESMAALDLDPALPRGEVDRVATQGILRRCGWQRQSIRNSADRSQRPVQLSGDAALVAALGEVLNDFVVSNRMKISPEQYRPCFELAHELVSWSAGRRHCRAPAGLFRYTAKSD